MKIVDGAIRKPVTTAVGAILLVMFGALALARIPVQLTPTVEEPQVTVMTIWPGASPLEIEREIVDEQEEQLKSLEGLVEMTSSSADSIGQISLRFVTATDLDTALLKVSNRLEQVPRYPDDAEKPIISSVDPGANAMAWFILINDPEAGDRRAGGRLDASHLHRGLHQARVRARRGRRLDDGLRRPRAGDAGGRRSGQAGRAAHHHHRVRGRHRPREPQHLGRRFRRGQAPLPGAHGRRVRLARGDRGASWWRCATACRSTCATSPRLGWATPSRSPRASRSTRR